MIISAGNFAFSLIGSFGVGVVFWYIISWRLKEKELARVKENPTMEDIVGCSAPELGEI